MWFKNIFHRRTSARDEPLFDEAFLRRLERLSLQAQRTLRGQPAGGEHPSRQQLPATIFSDHRPYSSGDDMRYVDWNAYARQGHVLVKLGETEQNVEVHLLLDSSRSMAWGDPPKLRTAQQLVGALGYLSLAHNDRVRVVPFGATAVTPFGPVQGKARLIALLQYIETVSLQRSTSLGSVLKQYAVAHPSGGLLVICSDLLSTEGLDEGLQMLLPPRWQVLVLHMLDPRELRPELRGPLELEDSETGQHMPITMDAETLATYRRRLAAWQHRIGAICSRRGVTYTRVLTTWPLEQKIVPYLRVRRFLT